ncbi:MAG: hypothetical protein RI909_298, partial [Bacteroidota bacterium]
MGFFYAFEVVICFWLIPVYLWNICTFVV